MEEELKQLKSILRSLVVSSPTNVDVHSLQRDYRNMVGSHIPIAKFGYNDAVTFLREKFSDCFLGPTKNPQLILIVPDALKHVDQFVQSQKSSTIVKLKGKRRSVPESRVKPQQSLIVQTFVPKKDTAIKSQPAVLHTNTNSSSKIIEPISNVQVFKKKDVNISNIENAHCSGTALKNFLKRRTALCEEENYENDQLDSIDDKYFVKEDDDSGRQTSSSTSSGKKTQLEETKREIRDLILDHPDGVWCTDLLRLYRERYGRELNFSRFGYTSVLSLACTVADVTVSRLALTGDWLLRDASSAAPLPARAPPRPRPVAPRPDPDDALPGIAFEADVFPEDCMHFLESIAPASLAGIGKGDMLEVAVAEVYSPSHFWLLRLGEQHNIAMENMMDDMNAYYARGEGSERRLALGAVRVGHYCSSCYEGDWHRSIIVKILDSDTVKVRHVDYGTVDRCDTRELRALRREWGALPAQAVRARLAGVRPPAAGRVWPRASAHHFLHLVRDKRFVANVTAVDAQDDALEVFLIDTSTEDDLCISTEMIRAGYADSRPDSTLGTSECYLFPLFAALESGDTPNFAEIHAYMRDGISLEFVEDYRRHVPSCLPDVSAAEERPASDATSETDESPGGGVSDDGGDDVIVDFYDTRAPSSPPKPRPALVPRGPPPPPPYPTRLPHSQPPNSNRVPLFLPPPPPPPPPAFTFRPAFVPYPIVFAPSVPNLTFVPGPPPEPHRLEQPSPANKSGVSLSSADCEVFTLLSRVDPGAAHRFMVNALSRAMSAPAPRPLNPLAAEFRRMTVETQTDNDPSSRGSSASKSSQSLRPPPGFESD